MRAVRSAKTAMPPGLAALAARVAIAAIAAIAAPVLTAACDKDSGGAAPSSTGSSASPLAPTPPASAPPDPPRAPDIVVDATNIAVGSDRVATGEMGLPDKVAVFVTGRPMIEGQTVSVVAMRNAKPSAVLAVVTALRRAKAAAAVVRTDTRDGTTLPLPLEFATTALDCAAVAWIGKDASIEVWPAGGGAAKKIGKGLAGPDMTLGGDAVRAQQSGCSASQLFVGADERLTWGLAFDLATGALTAPGSHVSRAVLITDPAVGKKLALQ
jgi:hypothetical protein